MGVSCRIRWSGRFLLRVMLCVACSTRVLAMNETVRALVTPLAQYGEYCGYDSCPHTRSDLLNVHVVPHSHGELGYQRTFPEHYSGVTRLTEKSVKNMKGIFDKVISELWAEERRTFSIADTAFFFQWWANRDETVRRMVYQLVRQGRLSFVGGGWSMPHEPCAGYHALLDMYTYSLRKINATFLSCARPLVTWQADSFGHSRELASLYAQMAFDAHFISYYDELRRMYDQRLEMIWRGSDDLGVESDIFTHKLFDGYASPPGFCFGYFCNDSRIHVSSTILNNQVERAQEFVESMSQRQGPHYATNHVLVVMGQRFGYFDADAWYHNIEALMEMANAIAIKKMRVFYSSPACYIRAVNEARGRFPAEQGDFVPTYIDMTSVCSGSFTSRPNVKFMAREAHVYLQMTKQLPVIADMPSDNTVYEEMNWITGALQDHNILSGMMSDHVMRYYAARLYSTVDMAIKCIAKAINKLRKSPYKTKLYRCQFNTSTCELTQGSGYFIVVYNPLAWAVSVPVRLPVVGSQPTYTIRNPNFSRVRYSTMKLPAGVLRSPGRGELQAPDHELVFLARALPPLGLRCYFLEQGDKALDRRSIYISEKYKNRKYLIRQTNKGMDNVPFQDTLTDSQTTTEAEAAGNESVTATENTEATEVTTEESLAIPSEPVVEEILTEKETRKADDDKQYVISKDKFINNKYVNISLDANYLVTSISLSNGVTIKFNIQMMFYLSDDPKRFNRGYAQALQKIDEKEFKADRDPNPHILRTLLNRPELIEDKDSFNTEVVKTDIVQELHVTVSSYASYSVRLYEDDPVVEVQWLVGPVPIHDDMGREVLIRYSTDLRNGRVFHTDSNGRQTVRRCRTPRDKEKVEMYPNSYVAGNIYPVTSKIHIEDKPRNLRFAVFTDRAQGGASMDEGQLDLMLHRRILTHLKPYRMILNETEHGQGMRVIGRHRLYLSKLDHKPHKIFEKKLAKELELYPMILLTHSNPYQPHTKNIWRYSRNEYSGLREGKMLPVGVHLLTLQEWNDNTLLIRLENFLEKADVIKSGIKIVFIRNLLKNITITAVRETTLDGSMWLSDWSPMMWDKREEFYENYNAAMEGDERRRSGESLRPLQVITNVSMGIQLVPQQIRTFVAWYERG